MKTYINPTITTELHEEIKSAQEFYDHAGGGFFPEDQANRIKKLATDQNLLKQNSYSETGIGALLKLSAQITKDAKEEGADYAKQAAVTMGGILKDIKPEIIKKGEEELAKQSAAKEINFKLSKPEIFMKKMMMSQEEKNEMLFEAVGSEEKDAIQTALKIGANIEARDGKGNTPLMYASHLASEQSIDMLISSGANVNAKNYAGEGVLHVISKDAEEVSGMGWGMDTEALVNKLISKGADVSAADIHGRTPIMKAEGLELVKALRYHGADVTKETKDFWKNEGKEDLGKDFEKYQADLNPTYKKTDEQVAKEAEELKMANTEAHDKEMGQSA